MKIETLEKGNELMSQINKIKLERTSFSNMNFFRITDSCSGEENKTLKEIDTELRLFVATRFNKEIQKLETEFDKLK